MNVLITGGAGFIYRIPSGGDRRGVRAGRAGDVGQTVDVFRFGRTDPVAVSVDGGGA